MQREPVEQRHAVLRDVVEMHASDGARLLRMRSASSAYVASGATTALAAVVGVAMEGCQAAQQLSAVALARKFCAESRAVAVPRVGGARSAAVPRRASNRAGVRSARMR